MNRAGAFAELVTVPAEACHCLPPELDDVQGSLVEPLACSLRAVRLADAGVETSIVIFGAGTIGLFALRAAKAAGVGRAAVVDTNPTRLQIAEAWGADLAINPREVDPVRAIRALGNGIGVDSGIDAVGLPVTRRQLVEGVRSGGTAVLIGLHENETSLACNDVVRREVQITGSFCYTWNDFTRAIRLLQAGKIVPDTSWLDERPLDEAKRSFDELIDSSSPITKIVLRP